MNSRKAADSFIEKVNTLVFDDTCLQKIMITCNGMFQLTRKLTSRAFKARFSVPSLILPVFVVLVLNVFLLL